MNDWLTTVAALAGTLFAGVGLELVKRWLARSSDKAAADAAIRGEYKEVIQDKRQDAMELKQDIENAEKKIAALEKDIAEWREKYYKAYEAKIETLSKLKVLEERIIRYEKQHNE